MIALYKGKSMLSRAIRWQTWSVYSHASWVGADGREIESWKGEGVHANETIGLGHTPGTEIDLFKLPAMDDVQRMRAQAMIEDQIGKPYDWGGVSRFVTRGGRHSEKRWFCSELVAWGCAESGHALLRLPAWKISPGLLAASPRIEYWKTIIAGEA